MHDALAHANYYGRRGILVVKKGKELIISNPGTIRVTKEEFYAGGNSDPRNPNILKIEVGQVVYIPGAADIRNTVEKSEAETITTMSKEDKVLAYIRQNGSISMQKVVESCNYRSRTGARKLIDKMINADLIEKIGKGNNTIYKIKE